MSDLIVYTYPTKDRAAEALAHVVTQKQENVQAPLVAVEDAAVAFKNADGKVKIQQTLEAAVKGSKMAGNGMWGLLIGFLFGGPLLGALLGMGLSGLFGRKLDLGIDNSFIKSVSDDLEPGNSVMFLLVASDTKVENISDALGDFKGRLYQTSLNDDAAKLLTEASDHDEIAAAVADEHDDD